MQLISERTELSQDSYFVTIQIGQRGTKYAILFPKHHGTNEGVLRVL